MKSGQSNRSWISPPLKEDIIFKIEDDAKTDEVTRADNVERAAEERDN